MTSEDYLEIQKELDERLELAKKLNDELDICIQDHLKLLQKITVFDKLTNTGLVPQCVLNVINNRIIRRRAKIVARRNEVHEEADINFTHMKRLINLLEAHES